MELFWKTIRSFTRKEKISIIILLSILLSSIFSIWDQNTDINTANAKIYNEGIVGEIKRLNPLFTEFSEADADISSLIFSGLVKYNPETKSFDEDLATHTLSEDQLTYTFTLKNNIYWHDGVELTADDIYFTYAEIIQSDEFKNPILKSNFQGVKIEKNNSRTISFTLIEPNSFFFSELTVGILPKHILYEVPIADLDIHEFNMNPIGSGPFKVEGPYQISEEGFSSIILSPFEDYYGEKPQMQMIKFTAFPSITELVENRSIWHGAARIQISLLRQIDTTNLNQLSYELPQYTALFFNTDSLQLLKNKTRLGISKAIDKSAILSAIDYSKGIDTPLLELKQEDWIHNYDFEEAQGALFDAGWKLNETTGIRENAESETLSLKLIRRDFSQSNEVQEQIMKKTVDLLQEQLLKIGIEIIVESYPEEELSEMIKSRSYDILLYGQSLGYNLDTFSYWHSSQATNEGLNLSNYRNPDADYLIEKIRRTFDEEEKSLLLNELATTISSDVPAVFLFTPTYYYLVDKNVLGADVSNILTPKDRLANISNWIFN